MTRQRKFYKQPLGRNKVSENEELIYLVTTSGKLTGLEILMSLKDICFSQSRVDLDLDWDPHCFQCSS